MKKFKGLYYLLILLISWSCRSNDDTVIPESETFEIIAPSNLGAVPFPEGNLFSEKKIELGRMLFYDPILSANNQVSCASCHNQSIAFTDGVALSNQGVSGQKLLRHSPAIINIAWTPGLFWEGGVKNIESLNLAPITHPDEMGSSVVQLVEEMNAHEHYPFLFREAFNVDEITITEISQGLSQFQRTLISANSKYDKYVRNEPGGDMTSLELEGLQLFENKCRSCHSSDLFTDNSFHNNGLDDDWSDISHEYTFTGRFRITFDSADLGKYKTPTLRNVALTAPYMHDGRLATLEAVLDHYSDKVKPSATLDSALFKADGAPGIEMTEKEKAALIAFISTLTDNEFINNPAFSKPE